MVQNAQSTTDQSGSPGEVVAEQVRQGTQQIAQATQQVAGQAAEQAQTMMAQRKGQATQNLHQVAHAFRQTGDQLRQNDQGMAARVLDAAAGEISSAAGYLENRDLPQLVNEAENFARRNSALFLGGAFALGVLAARFLKSSTPPPPTNAGYGPGYQYGPGGYSSSQEIDRAWRSGHYGYGDYSDPASTPPSPSTATGGE